MSSPEPTPRTSSRERLLAAADELFYAEGIAATGVEALVTRSGAARGSLYSHFGGKDGLVLAYLEARERRWRAVWDAALALHSDARRRVLAIFDALATWQASTSSDHGCAHAAAIAQLADDSPAREAARTYKASTRERLIELVAELLAAEGLGGGGRDAGTVEDLADEVLMIFEGTLVTRSIGIAADPLARGARLAEQVIEARLSDPDRRDG